MEIHVTNLETNMIYLGNKKQNSKAQYIHEDSW